MSDASKGIQAKLIDFEARFPAEGKNLRGLVSSSPELQSLPEKAHAAGHLDGGFEPLSEAKRSRGILGSYDSGTETISVPMKDLRSADADPKAANTVLVTLGHEAAHAIHKDDIRAKNEAFDAGLAGAAAGPAPRDYTAPIKEYLDESRQREAEDEIGGLNVLAAKVKRENPGASKQELFEAFYKSSDDVKGYFDVAGAGEKKVYTPKSGITFNADFQIEPNTENAQAFGKHFFDRQGYPANYGSSLIDEAARAEATALWAERSKGVPTSPAKVNLAALGIHPDDIDLPGSLKDSSTHRLAAGQPASTSPTPPGPSGEREPAATALEAEAPARPPSNLAPLSPTAEKLLQDSERFVRHTAEKHRLPWDPGMDNTVHAVAHGAKAAGMTGITHFRASNGVIEIAQHDGFFLKTQSLDARVAANTPAGQSREKLAVPEQEPAVESRGSPPQRSLEPERVPAH